MKLYTADEMARADGQAQRLGIPGGVLMERAGVAMAHEILERFPNRLRSALAVCGGGNNGGDGFVIARELRRAGARVSVVATKTDYSGDPETNLAALRSIGIRAAGRVAVRRRVIFSMGTAVSPSSNAPRGGSASSPSSSKFTSSNSSKSSTARSSPGTSKFASPRMNVALAPARERRDEPSVLYHEYVAGPEANLDRRREALPYTPPPPPPSPATR